MKNCRKSNKQLGVTLIELMIVLAIGAILATLAVPSFSDFINRTRQNSVSSQLVNDLHKARSEGIKRNARVIVCVRDTNTACGAGTNWANGWLVCADADSNNVCDVGTAANPNPIIVHSPLHSTLTLAGPNTVIRFNPSGISGNGAATLTVGGSWTGAVSSVINVAATGNISKP